MSEIATLERRILRVESVLILLSIAALGAADHLLAPGASLGFLYLIPMSFSALTHRWPWFIGLLALCVGRRQWDTPVQEQSWGRLAGRLHGRSSKTSRRGPSEGTLTEMRIAECGLRDGKMANNGLRVLCVLL